MSNFIIAIGHTASGNKGCGAVGRLDESICTREIGELLEKFLKEKGHNVNLIRGDKGNDYNYEDCYIRADTANNIAKNTKVDLYIEIHINAGGGSGTEVLVSGKSALANQYNPDVIERAIVCGLVGDESSSNNTWKLGWNKNNIWMVVLYKPRK